MKRLFLSISLAFVLPFTVSAFTVNTSASARTGGMTVQSGENAVTDSSSASVSVHTEMQGDTEHGVVNVQIVTNQNGVSHVESRTVPLSGDAHVVIIASTSGATPSQKKILIKQGIERPPRPGNIHSVSGKSDAAPETRQHASTTLRVITPSASPTVRRDNAFTKAFSQFLMNFFIYFGG